MMTFDCARCYIAVASGMAGVRVRVGLYQGGDVAQKYLRLNLGDLQRHCTSTLSQLHIKILIRCLVLVS